MTALAFESEITGNTIVIPEEYRGKISSTVLVTLIESPRFQSDQEERKKTMRFSLPHIDTQGWKFDREEANAR